MAENQKDNTLPANSLYKQTWAFFYNNQNEIKRTISERLGHKNPQLSPKR